MEGYYGGLESTGEVDRSAWRTQMDVFIVDPRDGLYKKK
jgi:hypothetical protein